MKDIHYEWINTSLTFTLLYKNMSTRGKTKLDRVKSSFDITQIASIGTRKKIKEAHKGDIKNVEGKETSW